LWRSRFHNAESVAGEDRARRLLAEQIAAVRQDRGNPLRTFSPRIRVACPSRPPATSVIVFRGPVESVPGVMPGSRARGLDSRAAAAARIHARRAGRRIHPGCYR
jgi:hypothetical protein